MTSRTSRRQTTNAAVAGNDATNDAPFMSSTTSQTRPHTLASICGFDPFTTGIPIPESVHRASAGLELHDELIQKLQASPGRQIGIGQVIEYDCRPQSAVATASSSSSKSPASSKKKKSRSKSPRRRRSNSRGGGEVETATISTNITADSEPRELTLIQWNIERGYKLPEIIALLKDQNADIIALQEVDIGCARSGWHDTGRMIAEALGMNYSFVSEFNELYSPMRPDSAQGGGIHGNAILSRFDHKNTHVVAHKEIYDWNARGHLKKEPRIGSRFTIATEVQTPNGPLLVYSAHLEVFSGVLGRVENFKEILADSNAQRHVSHQVIMGDFNTLSHGIARFSPEYSTDHLRWRSLGYTEAEWWVRHILTNETHNPDRFYDPFDAYFDVTLTNYRGWFNGKLDWMLLRNLTHVSHSLDNNDYHASDHKLLRCTVRFDPLPGSSHAATTPPPPKDLHSLMPLRRARPGFVTTSASRIHEVLFVLVLLAAIGYLLSRFVFVL